MVAEALQRMIELADSFKEQKREPERRAVQLCMDYLHEAWRESELTKVRISDPPESDLEKVVYCIPGISVYKDKSQKLYELDGCRFESEYDTLQYLIDTREAERKRARLWARKDAAEYMARKIREIEAEARSDGFKKRVARPRTN